MPRVGRTRPPRDARGEGVAVPSEHKPWQKLTFYMKITVDSFLELVIIHKYKTSSVAARRSRTMTSRQSALLDRLVTFCDRCGSPDLPVRVGRVLSCARFFRGMDRPAAATALLC